MKVRYDHVTVLVARPRLRDGATFELLQLRRQANEYLGGTWQTVRGTMEPGETAIQTALRELREETGLTPVEFYTLGIVETFYIAAEDAVWHSPAFVAIVGPESPVTLNDEHDDLRWVRAAEAEEHFMWPSERPLLREMRDAIFNGGLAKSLLRIDL